MITNLFLSVFQDSIVTSFVVLMLLVLSPFLNKHYTAKWRYWIWIFLALCFVIPINGSNKTSAENLQSQTKIQSFSQQKSTQKNHSENMLISRQRIVVEIPTQITKPILPQLQKHNANITWLNIFAYIWFICSLSFILFHLLSYLYYRRQIVKNGICVKEHDILQRMVQLSEELHIKQTVPVIEYIEASSPMVIGFFRPILVLPKEQYSAEELFFILKHEFVHLKRHDVFFKLLLTIANAMHWFNPLVWIMQKEAIVDMELSCDERVVQGTDYSVRKAYTETLYATLHKGFVRKTVFSTQFYGGKQIMKRRFQNILAKAKKKNGIVLLVCAVIVTVICGTFVGCSVKAAKQPQEDNTTARNELEQSEDMQTKKNELEKIGFEKTDTNKTDFEKTEIELEEFSKSGIVMENIEVPDIVLENAKKQVFDEYNTDVLTDKANNTEYNYSNWRITSLELCYTYEDLDSMILPIYQLDFAFLSDTPENVVLTGGASITEDGWVTPDYPNSRFLIFKQEGETLSYLTCLFENDCMPGDEVFTNDLKLKLKKLGIPELQTPEIFAAMSGKWIIDFERTDTSIWGTGISYGNEMELSESGAFQYYIGIGSGGIGQCEIKDDKVIAEVEAYEDHRGEKENFTLQYVDDAEQEYILMDWYNNDVYWIRNNTMTTAIVVHKEGEAEHVEAVLTEGKGYSIYLTAHDWQQEDENTWIALINNQVRLWITHFEGKTANQVKQELADNGYVVINGIHMKQEGEIVYKIELKEYSDDIWGVCRSYPIDAEEGWGSTITSIAETFTAMVEDADYTQER